MCFQELADQDPEKVCCYLPYAKRRDYWEECIDYAGKKFPGLDWSKSYPWFKRTWANNPQFKNMKILKNKPVSKCKICLDFRKELMAAPMAEVPGIRAAEDFILTRSDSNVANTTWPEFAPRPAKTSCVS